MRLSLPVLLAGLAACSPPPLAGQSGRIWAPEERVLISDFSRISAVARDNEAAYAVTPNGILVYDLISRRFRLPLTAEDGFPAREQPLSITYSPADFTLLLGTGAGGLYTLQTLSPRFDVVTRLGSPIVALQTVAATSDLYAQTPAGWFRLRSGSFQPEPVAAAPRFAPPGAEDPYLRSMLATVGNIAGRGTAPVSALATGVRPGTYIAGTFGNGLVVLDTRTLERTPLSYGLNTRGSTAVASWAGRLWFGGDARAVGGSVVSSSPDLTDFRNELPGLGAPQDAVTAMYAADSTLWVGTTSGLWAGVHSGRATDWRSFTRDVPDPVNAIVGLSDAVVVGTDRGATMVRGTATQPILTGGRVSGLVVRADTLWMATDVGIALLPLGVANAQAAVLRGAPAPPGPIAGVAALDETLFAVTPDGVYERGARGWRPPDRAPAERLGALVGVRSGGGFVWVFGVAGFAVKRAQSAAWTYYVGIGDIPEGPVRDLLPLGEHVWLATPAGALRVSIPR